MRKTLVVAVACALCAGARATEYWLKSGTADWSEPGSFTTGSASGPDATVSPGAADEVHLPAAVVTLTAGTASFATAAGVSRIIPVAESQLVLMVDNDEPGVEKIVEFAAAINAGDGTDATPLGTVVKNGSGSLSLTSKVSARCYFTSFSVQAGSVRLPQPATHTYYANLTLADGATLYLPNGGYSRFRRIDGREGAEITCQGGSPYLLLEQVSADYPTSAYSGKISGSIQVIANGLLKLTNAESTYSGLTQVYNQYNSAAYGTIETTEFGLSNAASPLGSNAVIYLSYNGGGYRYVGTSDETTDKTIGILQATSGYSHFIDAGAHGGVTFTGGLKYQHPSGQSVTDRFILTGSNAVSCVIAGPITDWYRTNGAHHEDRPVYFSKTGTGTWKFTDAACGAEGDSWFYGGFRVAGGSLQFTSIADIGKKCSLGYATFLTREMSGVASADDKRDYAYTIGTESVGKEAVFEYVGDTPSVTTNRKTVIVGTGTIRSSATGTGWLGMCGISARDAGGATLVLDGTNANGNVVENVSDGAGSLSVVKRGTGTWALAGDQTFTGSLSVEDGTLNVIAPKYTWFRFTLKETGNPSASGYAGQTVFRQLALYDKDGVRRNVGLSAVIPEFDTGSWYRTRTNFRTLSEGVVQWGNDTQHKYPSNQYLDVLFSDDPAKSTFSGCVSTGVFSRNNESTWLPIVMRLPADTPEIVRWDYVTFHTGIYQRWPKLVMIEGSTDGMSWTVLDDRDIDLTAANAKENCWVSDASGFSKGQVRKDCGFALSSGHASASMLALVSAVRVAGKGTLCAKGAAINLNNLIVDCADCGKISGFSFGKTGTLTVKSSASGACSLPDFLENPVDAENLANWSLVLNGKARSNWKIVVDGTRIRLLPPGMVLIVR